MRERRSRAPNGGSTSVLHDQYTQSTQSRIAKQRDCAGHASPTRTTISDLQGSNRGRSEANTTLVIVGLPRSEPSGVGDKVLLEVNQEAVAESGMTDGQQQELAAAGTTPASYCAMWISCTIWGGEPATTHHCHRCRRIWGGGRWEGVGEVVGGEVEDGEEKGRGGSSYLSRRDEIGLGGGGWQWRPTVEGKRKTERDGSEGEEEGAGEEEGVSPPAPLFVLAVARTALSASRARAAFSVRRCPPLSPCWPPHELLSTPAAGRRPRRFLLSISHPP
ncbi:hypothetical protein [Oryza sativa Japonica Group]|uniref:Uncharacterized protein n=1 Tax=Oryza sativa subsp. japonica TaxID=39947 RepID=Q5VPB8_ORYSJ|nr:hypothetical protein [Oryza sativa Japonica Group]BAD68708.1 hypothetical protein [Oryza sativa Japonica Group]